MTRAPVPQQDSGGGLHLPRDVGMAASQAAAVASRWSSTIHAVNARLAQKGFFELPIPQMSCPEVTTEALLTTDVRAYTVVYEGQLRWYNYTAVLYARCRATLLGVEGEMDDIAAKKRVYFRQCNESVSKDKKLGVAEMNDLIDQDPVFNELKLQKQDLQQSKLQLEAHMDGLERSLKVVSRQIEVRKIEGTSGNRAQNMPQQNSWGDRR